MELKERLQKPYNENERLNFIVTNNHNLGYEIRETENELQAWGKDAAELLQDAKDKKVKENDTTRDVALNQGVTYKDILFDSDTDQKVNLLAIVSTMEEGQTITWFGKDNVPLICEKEDLINIGGLITQLHSFCWNKNAEYKAAIGAAQSIDDLNLIIISYELPTEVEESEEE